MKNTLLLLLLTLSAWSGRAQTEPAQKIVYIVDSVPILNDPSEEDANMDPNTIGWVTIIKNKDSLRSLGYEGQDEAIFIFTKKFANRPEAIKKIPTTMRMIKQNDQWFIKGDASPYTGPFIDYYLNGDKQGEGSIKDGRLEGQRIQYYRNGKVQQERYYTNGIPNGTEKENYPNGALKQKGDFSGGKEQGIWESYYPNGQVEQHGWLEQGTPNGEVLLYYSNGKLREKIQIKDGKVIHDPAMEKIYKLYSKGLAAEKEEDLKAAIRYYTQCLAIDSGFMDAWFARGTARLNNEQFDAALADFDKAIALEPFDMGALANRAFCRIRKYQFKSGRVLSQRQGVTVMASPDHPPIPEEEHDKICGDLRSAVFLGDHTAAVKDALKEHCGSQ